MALHWQTFINFRAGIVLAGIILLCQQTVVAQDMQASNTYVAMGSSYAAGVGVGKKDIKSGDCMRSFDNYAQKLATIRDIPLTDVSCANSTTHDILSRHHDGFAPQIDAATADTRLITVNIGAHEVGYVVNLLGESCRDEAAQFGRYSPCTILSDKDIDVRMKQLPGQLDAVISALKAKAPYAKIVIVGYLPVVPNSTGCAGIPLTVADANNLIGIYKRLMQIEKERSRANGVMFISAAELGRGHEACSLEPYTANFHPRWNPGWNNPVPYHPTLAGMVALANAIDDALDR